MSVDHRALEAELLHTAFQFPRGLFGVGRRQRCEAGEAWHNNDLVFCHENGTAYTSDALNWRFSKMTRKAGIGHWHAHEGRHTAVSIMSSNGVPLQEISDTVGHKSTHVTETVYRHEIRPALTTGATAMNKILAASNTTARNPTRNTKKNRARSA